MIGIDTPIPGIFILLTALLGLLSLGWVWRLNRQVLQFRYLCWLTGLRLLSLTAVLLLLLQPYIRRQQPDPEKFEVALLIDASASMLSKDVTGNKTRLAVAQSFLDAETAPWRDFFRAYSPRIYAFSEKIQLQPAGRPLSVMPGQTAAGDVLLETMQTFSSMNLAGILLLSDGNSNQGRAVTDAAKLMRTQGIPVSAVGIGSKRVQGDMAVTFTVAQGSLKGTKGRELRLPCRVTSTFRDTYSARIELSRGGLVLESRELAVPGNGFADIEFRVRPASAGMQTYSVHLQPPAQDEQPDTDVDYLAVEIAEPDRFNVLYLGGHLSWEYKFLKIVVDDSPQLSMSALIRTAENAFFSADLPGLAKTGEALAEIVPRLVDFDALLVDTRLLENVPVEFIRALLVFVENRGGGLLLFGPSALVPEELIKALPVTPVPVQALTARTGARPRSLKFFATEAPPPLDAPPGLFLQRLDPVQFFSPENLKRGAVTVLAAESESALLALQLYGSGRSAFTGTENTWRWRLGSTAGATAHQWFWRNLLVWLGSASKDRVSSPNTGQKTAVGNAVEVGLQVLDNEFNPAAAAEVFCVIVAPDGGTRELRLDPAPEVEGNFSGLFTPEKPGEHKLMYRAGLGTETLHLETAFLARHETQETRDPGYRQDTLLDLARITGGRFWNYDQIDRLTPLPLRGDVPLLEYRKPLVNPLLLLPLLIAWLCGEWYMRRRVGLK